jgi:hypothetical protein
MAVVASFGQIVKSYRGDETLWATADRSPLAILKEAQLPGTGTGVLKRKGIIHDLIISHICDRGQFQFH